MYINTPTVHSHVQETKLSAICCKEEQVLAWCRVTHGELVRAGRPEAGGRLGGRQVLPRVATEDLPQAARLADQRVFCRVLPHTQHNATHIATA